MYIIDIRFTVATTRRARKGDWARSDPPPPKKSELPKGLRLGGVTIRMARCVTNYEQRKLPATGRRYAETR